MVLPVGKIHDVHEVVRLFLPYAVDEAGIDALQQAMNGSIDEGTSEESGSQSTLRPRPWARLLLILSYRVHWVSIVGEALWVRTGVLIRKLTIVPLRRMQSVGTFRGPFHALTGMDGMESHIVPGPGVTRMVGFSEDEAEIFLQELMSRVVEATSRPEAMK